MRLLPAPRVAVRGAPGRHRGCRRVPQLVMIQTIMPSRPVARRPPGLADTAPAAAPRRREASPQVIASILDSLRRTIRGFRALAQRAEATMRLSGAQHFVLEHLAQGPVATLNELATRTLTHKSSLSVVVARLVERGYVVRTASRHDRRRAGFALTAAGRRALRRAPASAQQRMISALGRLGAGDAASFARLFARVNRELGFDVLAPTMIFEKDPRAGRSPRGRRTSTRKRP